MGSDLFMDTDQNINFSDLYISRHFRTIYVSKMEEKKMTTTEKKKHWLIMPIVKNRCTLQVL